MYKSRKNSYKKYIITILIGLGLSIFSRQNFIESVYATDTNTLGFIGNALNNLLDGAKGGEIDKIFDGKGSVENLYMKSLESIEKDGLKNTKTTLDQIQFQIAQNNVEKSDLLNILYDSNPKVKLEIEKTSCKDIKSTPPKNCKIEPEVIENSYRKLAIAICGKDETEPTKITLDQRNCVKKQISDNYQILSNNNKNIQEFSAETIGEDLFMNGSIEDSSYDLVVDVNRIGNILFNSFKAPVETLFYKFPGTKGVNDSKKSTNNGNNNQPTNTIELLQAILNNNGINAGGTNKTGIVNNNNSTIKNTTNIISGTNNGNNTEIEDPEIKGLINNTNIENKQENGMTQGNICITDIPSEIPENIVEENITEEEKQAYIDGLNDFIQNDRVLEENKNVLNVSKQTAGGSDGGFEDSVSNAINDMFDNEQVESCSSKCESLDYDDKIICNIECLCFNVSYPQFTEPKLSNWNDSLRLRFCTIPVQAKSIKKGKDINSFDEMLNRIQAIFTNLLNGGEMITYQKTKEYLDSPIAPIKWSDMFVFNIGVKFKSIFANTQKKTKETKEIEKIKKEQSNVGGKNENPVLDINKYVIIKDISKTKILKSSNANNLDELLEDQEAYKKASEELIIENNINPNQIKNQKSAMVNGIWGEFLSKNNKFWTDMTTIIEKINSQAANLKNKEYNK